MNCFGIGKDDYYGLIFMRRDDNLFTANLFYCNVDAGRIAPFGAEPTIIRVNTGVRLQPNREQYRVLSKRPTLCVVLVGPSPATQFTNNCVIRPTP